MVALPSEFLNHCANISTYTQSIMTVLRLSPCDGEDSFVPRDGPGKVIRIPKVVAVCLVDKGAWKPGLGSAGTSQGVCW